MRNTKPSSIQQLKSANPHLVHLERSENFSDERRSRLRCGKEREYPGRVRDGSPRSLILRLGDSGGYTWPRRDRDESKSPRETTKQCLDTETWQLVFLGITSNALLFRCRCKSVDLAEFPSAVVARDQSSMFCCAISLVSVSSTRSLFNSCIHYFSIGQGKQIDRAIYWWRAFASERA
jgi:hypothetical protein